MGTLECVDPGDQIGDFRARRGFVRLRERLRQDGNGPPSLPRRDERRHERSGDGLGRAECPLVGEHVIGGAEALQAALDLGRQVTPVPVAQHGGELRDQPEPFAGRRCGGPHHRRGDARRIFR